MRRSLAAVLLVALAACGGSGDGTPRPARSSGAEETTTTTGPASGGEAAAGSPAGAGPSQPGTAATPRPGSPGGGQAGGAAAQQPAPQQPAGAAPAPARPVAAGTYRFDTTGETRVGDGPPRPVPRTTTLTVERPQGTRQKATRDLRDQDGTGSVTEQVLDYRNEGVRLVSMTIRTSFGGVTNTYRFNPAEPPMVIRTGSKAGDVNQFTVEGDGVRIATTARVRSVDSAALVVELDSALSGRLSGHQRAVNRIESGTSLTVHEDVDTDVTAELVRVRGRYTAAVKR